MSRPIVSLLSKYLGQAELRQRFLDFDAEGPQVYSRKNLAGHFTASAWLVLLTLHKKLGRWLQLGGHADEDVDLRRVALKEAEEESGLTGLSVDESVFDLDLHSIPARPNEPEHWHWDVRFVVRAGSNEAFAVSEESLKLSWVAISDIANAKDDRFDESLRRMAQKSGVSGTADKWLVG
jgi:8-oxo-dGTP pyrophosphatase MutT (NUDIX family)